ncbi:MAG TPA: SEC-C metal-binding domain-containing protein [Phycisphaerae bacterium]|nr:SEC-C metal-binding domain-containing protein [Phycisphaerae bacterium]
MERNDLICNVVQAAAEFNGRRLWERFSNYDCFAVKVPGQEAPVLGVVMGDAGEQFGLSLFRGSGAAAYLAGVLDSDGPGDDMPEEMDMLGFSMDAFGELLPEAQAYIREAGLHPRYGDPIPRFLVKCPGRQPRLPDESELRLLLMVLRGAAEADRKKLLQPAPLEDPDGVCTLVLVGDPATPQVSVTREVQRASETPRSVPIQPLTPDLAGLPRLGATWLAGLPVMPGGIQGDDRSLQLLLVADDVSRLVLLARPLFADELPKVVDALVETFRSGGMSGRKGLPRKIVFSSKKLHDVLAAALRQSGVTCLYVPVIPKLQEIISLFFEGIGGGLPPFSKYLKTAGAPPVPAPDDLAGWKEADRNLTSRFAAFVESDDRFRAARAVKRYFGRDDLEHFLEAHKTRSVVPAYAAWGILDYRPIRKSKTRAEEMLAAGLPEPEARLLRARIEAHPTLYRVAGHNPKAGTIDLEDVLLGGAVTVHDQLMSENIENGLFIAGRAFPAGRFHFLELAGPPLGAAMGLEAVEFLQDCGMEFKPDGLRRDAHLFGWLWGWSDEWEANWKPPRLCNTDGDDLLWHTASFSVANQSDARRALLQREDIQHDEQDDEFVWVKDTGRGAKMLGGPATLGRIEFVGDELVLTVNSAKRFTAARKWLEEVPGVVFSNVVTRRLDGPKTDRPMDERISKPQPVEITPEMASAVQKMIDKQYMEWLDEPLPILGDKTPRQACRTPDGRQQVTMLIRTMPDPMGQTPVQIPRQAMLRELGLASEPSAVPPLGPPMTPLSAPVEPTSPDRKVGRNDPCPCGSGKKYKKCCGRPDRSA